MLHSTSLKSLEQQICSRLGRLIAIEGTLLLCPSSERIKLTGYILVDALAAWSAFTREYTLSCLWRGAFSETHGPIIHAMTGLVPTERVALIEAIKATKKPSFAPADDYEITPFDEPVWRKGQTILRIAEKLSFNNFAQVQTAFSIPGTALEELPLIRNFYAHKDRKTAEVVRKLGQSVYGVPALKPAHELVSEILPEKTDSLLSEWLHQLHQTSQALCV